MRSPLIRSVFRFYSELNYFLLPRRRFRSFDQIAAESDTIKHVVESLGVPHTEVAMILVSGEAVTWQHHLRGNELVSVFPAFMGIAIPPEASLLPPVPEEPRFVLDGHLGRLAAYLRMLGFDCWYTRAAGDEQLAGVSAAEDRILLTRDVGLLKRSNIVRGRFIRSDNPGDQLIDVCLRFNLLVKSSPFSRCMECNTPLSPAAKADVADRLPPHTRATKDEFSTCSECLRIYWKGSHHSEMSDVIQALREKVLNA